MYLTTVNQIFYSHQNKIHYPRIPQRKEKVYYALFPLKLKEDIMGSNNLSTVEWVRRYDSSFHLVGTMESHQCKGYSLGTNNSWGFWKFHYGKPKTSVMKGVAHYKFRLFCFSVLTSFSHWELSQRAGALSVMAVKGLKTHAYSTVEMSMSMTATMNLSERARLRISGDQPKTSS